MHIAFIDESGDPGDPSQGSPSLSFVIGAVIINEKDWIFMKESVENIKRSIGLNPFTEVKWRHCMEPAGKPPKKAGRPNPLSLLDNDQREKYALGMLAVVRRITDARIVTCVIDKARHTRELTSLIRCSCIHRVCCLLWSVSSTLRPQRPRG